MLGLLAAPNVFMIFICWELVSLCSYLLIGFWYEEKSNCDAANKAFVVNRVGDIGMLIGLGLLWTNLGTFDFRQINTGIRDHHGELNHQVVAGENVVPLLDAQGQPVLDDATGAPRQIPYWLLVVAGLGVFAGCVGKSAQFPLHVWLPDAMAGPTPVSALIHAATMVAAGVYLVGRFFPLFTPEVLLYIGYTGGITLFVAATIAVVQTDYKKVLAYSTISQLGFMMLALGVGGWAAGLFHLITHAFFKALLFLCAGSVYHSVHTYEMPALGGLFKKMPTTALCMLIGTLAISGVPFFSGFYSKDAILAAAMNRVYESPGHFMLFVLPAVGAAITAFYMFRMWLLVFAGEARGFPSHTISVHTHVAEEEHAAAHGHEHDTNPALHAHESGPTMTLPLVILAVLSVFSGWTVWLGLPGALTGMVGLPSAAPILESMLEYGAPLVHHGAHWGPSHFAALIASLIIATTGIGLAFLFYAPADMPHFVPTRWSAERVVRRSPGIHRFLAKKWYFDELYNLIFVRPCLAFARACSQLDKIVVDGLVNASAFGTELLSRGQGLFDKIAVDGLVNLSAWGVYFAGEKGRAIQTGRLRNYLMLLAAGLVGLFAGVFAWVSG
jgi:proton-translocating NADH-quinone oxidoreductase chain L